MHLNSHRSALPPGSGIGGPQIHRHHRGAGAHPPPGGVRALFLGGGYFFWGFPIFFLLVFTYICFEKRLCGSAIGVGWGGGRGGVGAAQGGVGAGQGRGGAMGGQRQCTNYCDICPAGVGPFLMCVLFFQTIFLIRSPFGGHFIFSTGPRPFTRPYPTTRPTTSQRRGFFNHPQKNRPYPPLPTAFF